MPLSRRSFLVDRAGPAVGLALFARFLTTPTVAGARDRTPIFGGLGAPDRNGLRLPPGFRSREIARTGDPVGRSGHVWHGAPDGGACFSRPDGGWIYASNSEISTGRGGVSCVSFDADGRIDDAYRVLSGTSVNCAGGATPWGTWLSCEEFDEGLVWECDPTTVGQGIARPAMGTFAHEAAGVDPWTGTVFLTEDRADGRLYRFEPDRPGDLTSGTLAAAVVSRHPDEMSTGDTATITWTPTSRHEPDRSPTTSAFRGGEGIWIEGRTMFFTTKRDRRVWTLDLSTSTLSVLHDCVAEPDTPLDAVDNIVVHHDSGDVFVAEDGGNMQIGVLRQTGGTVQVDAFLEFVGHDDSEVTGPAFAPDGTRMYLSSQRGSDGRGVTYEVSGPFTSPGRLRPARRMSSGRNWGIDSKPTSGGSSTRPPSAINGPAANSR